MCRWSVASPSASATPWRRAPKNVQRLVVFLAVRGRPQRRSAVAGNLWMDTTDDRAGANLRTTLSRARQLLGAAVVVNGDDVVLADDVDVDLHMILERAAAAARAVDAARPRRRPGGPARRAAAGPGRGLAHVRAPAHPPAVRPRPRGAVPAAVDGRARRAGSRRRPRRGRRRAAARERPPRPHRGPPRRGILFEARRQYDSFRALTREHLGVEPSASLRALVETGWPLTGAIGAFGSRGTGDRWARSGPMVTGRGTAVP